MKKLKILLDCILSCKIWLLCILGLNLSFIFFAWIAYSEALSDLRLLMLFVSAGVMIIPLISLVRQQLRIHRAFCLFLSEPDPETEELLWENVPRTERSRIRLLGEHLRKAQNFMENQATMIADYEDYIENWAHEIKKPLSGRTEGGFFLNSQQERRSHPGQARQKHHLDGADAMGLEQQEGHCKKGDHQPADAREGHSGAAPESGLENGDAR